MEDLRKLVAENDPQGTGTVDFNQFTNVCSRRSHDAILQYLGRRHVRVRDDLTAVCRGARGGSLAGEAGHSHKGGRENHTSGVYFDDQSEFGTLKELEPRQLQNRSPFNSAGNEIAAAAIHA
jgi:hypothetical protein